METWQRAVTVLAGLFLMIVFAWGRKPVSAERRAKRGQAWAQQHLAFVSGPLTTALDAYLERRKHLAGTAVLLIGLMLVVIGAGNFWLGGSEFLLAWVCLIGFGTAMAVAGALAVAQLARPSAPLRTAHVRAVAVNDYAPFFMRASSALAGALSLGVAIVLVGLGAEGDVTQPLGYLAAACAAAVSLAALLADWAARRIAASPQPAEDPTHLYWQDAVRSEAIKQAFGQVPLWGGQVCLVGANLAHSPATFPWIDGLWIGTALMHLLALVSAVLAFDSLSFRRRLWPTLAPGQVLMPGEQPPPRGVVRQGSVA